MALAHDINGPGVSVSLKESAAYGLLEQHTQVGAGGGLKPTADVYNQLRTGTLHTWVYACVFQISSSGAMTPFVVRRDKGENSEDVTLSDDFSVFRKPNPWMSRYDLWEATWWFLELGGQCFWELVPPEKPKEIYPLRPDKMKIVPDADKFVRRYDYEVRPNKIIHFEPEEIFHLKYFNPLSEYHGLTAISAGEQAIVQDLMSVSYNRRFFENSATPGGILSTDQQLDDPTIKRIVKQHEKMHKGVSKAHRLMVIEKGLKYSQMGLSQHDMEFIESRKMNREEIHAVFGVPPVKTGLLEHASYSNAKEQDRHFWEDTMGPKITKLGEAITAHLLPRLGDNLVGYFDLSDIPALQEDENERAIRFARQIMTGQRSPNETRQEDGYEPYEGGDVYYVPGNLVPAGEVGSGNGNKGSIPMRALERRNWNLLRGQQRY